MIGVLVSFGLILLYALLYAVYCARNRRFGAAAATLLPLSIACYLFVKLVCNF